MSKFKYISKKGQVSVTLKLVSGEQINTGEAAYFAGNFFKGFLRPASGGSGKIIYTGGQGISLSQFLRRSVTKDQFFIIIAQLLEAYKTIVCANLNPISVNLDPELITINENTGELYLVYQPIIGLKTPNQGFMRCFAQICSMLRFATPEDKASVDGFVNFARQLSAFSVGEIENYIMYASPITYSHVQRRPMQGNPVQTPGNVSVPEPVSPVQPEPAAVPMQRPENISVPEPVIPIQPEPAAVPVQAPENISVPEPVNQVQPEPVAVPVQTPENISAPEPVSPIQPEPAAVPVQTPENVSAPEPVSPIQPEPAAVPVQTPENISVSESVTTSQPDAEKATEEIPAQPLSDFSPKKDTADEEQSTVAFPAAEEDDDAGDGDTVIISSAAAAKLFRRATGEAIDINKDAFVVGKERAKVDYAVTGNKTVSRVHATIYRRDDVFMIVDNGSTNRTCINGSPIPPHIEIRLNSGDVVKLANEEFDFTVPEA